MIYIFGNDQQVKEIAKRLKDSSSILTYDLKKPHIIDGKEFNITEAIIIVADKEQLQLFEKKQILRTNIIEYYLFKDLSCEGLLPDNVGEDVDTLIFGMSHSQCGIETINGNILKLSKPSMDLFLQNNIVNLLYSRTSHRQIKRVFLELPYYIFNYDLSMFKPFVFTKFNYFVEVGKFHHLADKDDLDVYIRQYELFTNMFHRIETPNVRKINILFKAFKYFKYKAKVTYDVITNNDAVWNRLFIQAISENKKYFLDFISQVKSFYPDAEISIIVMPFNPLFRLTHYKRIQRMRNIFYDIVSLANVKVMDDFALYNNLFLFDDHCHLSKRGAKKYTKYFLNKDK